MRRHWNSQHGSLSGVGVEGPHINIPPTPAKNKLTKLAPSMLGRATMILDSRPNIEGAMFVNLFFEGVVRMLLRLYFSIACHETDAMQRSRVHAVVRISAKR